MIIPLMKLVVCCLSASRPLFQALLSPSQSDAQHPMLYEHACTDCMELHTLQLLLVSSNKLNPQHEVAWTLFRTCDQLKDACPVWVCHAGIKNKGDRDYGTYDLVRLKKWQHAEMLCGRPNPCPEFQLTAASNEHFFDDTLPPELSGQIFDEMQQVLDSAAPFCDDAYEAELDKIRSEFDIAAMLAQEFPCSCYMKGCT